VKVAAHAGLASTTAITSATIVKNTKRLISVPFTKGGVISPTVAVRQPGYLLQAS
jgi:hypothetical protein